MLTRRQLLERMLKGSSLIALGAAAPRFLAATAAAAEPGKDTVLVVLEMTGGNDGLNTVVPYGDDRYHAARPTLALPKEQVVRIDDYLGLNPGLRSFEALLSKGQLAIVQGVGYPNPDRSHFESMDIWHSADPRRQTGNGWLGRSVSRLNVEAGHIAAVYVGTQQLPLAMQGSTAGAPTIHYNKPYDLELAPQQANAVYFGDDPFGNRYVPGAASASGGPRQAARRQLIEDLAKMAPAENDLLQFVQQAELHTYATIDRLKQIAAANRQGGYPRDAGYRSPGNELALNLNLIAQMIAAELGTRIFYVTIGGFDTHADQQREHQQLLQQVADGVTGFFTQLERSGQADRVLLMTFSEFGRRVQENGSRGTDHGAASCLFVAGPGVQGGVIGKHPSLASDDLDAGDLKHHTDFRQVYATLLDRWLGCPSQDILAGQFDHLPLLKKT